MPSAVGPCARRRRQKGTLYTVNRGGRGGKKGLRAGRGEEGEGYYNTRPLEHGSSCKSFDQSWGGESIDRGYISKIQPLRRQMRAKLNDGQEENSHLDIARGVALWQLLGVGVKSTKQTLVNCKRGRPSHVLLKSYEKFIRGR